MKFLILVLMSLPSLALAEKVEIYVPGMVCQMCVQGMQKQFKSVVADAEKDVLVDLDTMMVNISTLEPISDEEIKKRVNDAGYNAKKITRLSQTNKKE